LSDEIAVQIQRRETEFLPLCSRMEEFKIQFIIETVSFASEWYRKTAKEYVSKYPDVTLSMSEEKIAQMKTKINVLVVNAEKTVKDELDNSALWWHQKPHLHNSIEQYTQISDKYPELLDHAIRRILGPLGVILEEFRFHVTAGGNAGSYQEFWFEHRTGTEQTIPYYPHLLKWTEEMQETIRKYNAQFIQASTLFNEIQQLKEQKKRQEAITRWELT
jgi:predicted DNA binding CopG/RHH family protein